MNTFAIPYAILEPEISIIRAVFDVANSAIKESIKTPSLPKAFSAANDKGASDKDNSFHPTKAEVETATKI